MDASRKTDEERGREESRHPRSDYDPPKDPETDMPPTPEEKARLADAPKGTLALLIVVAILLFTGWALLYFGRFLGSGPVR